MVSINHIFLCTFTVSLGVSPYCTNTKSLWSISIESHNQDYSYLNLQCLALCTLLGSHLKQSFVMLFKYSKDICEAFSYPSSWKHYSAERSALGLYPPVTATQLPPSLKSLYAVITVTVSVFHLPWASPVAQLVKNLLAIQETWVQSLAWEDPLEKGEATDSSILTWRIPWTV